MSKKALSIVPVEEIPKVIHDCPVDDLSLLYRTCLLLENLCLTENGIGISAVQVGIPWKLFIVRYEGNKFRYFINCIYDPIDDEKEKSIEGCLSLKTESGDFRQFEVERYARIRVTGQELLTKPKICLGSIALNPEDYYKVVFQHEIDHGLGILISDIGKEMQIWKS